WLVRAPVQHALAAPGPPRDQPALPGPELRGHALHLGSSLRHLRGRARGARLRAGEAAVELQSDLGAGALLLRHGQTVARARGPRPDPGVAQGTRMGPSTGARGLASPAAEVFRLALQGRGSLPRDRPRRRRRRNHRAALVPGDLPLGREARAGRGRARAHRVLGTAAPGTPALARETFRVAVADVNAAEPRRRAALPTKPRPRSPSRLPWVSSAQSTK